jgi:hypothetical protein
MIEIIRTPASGKADLIVIILRLGYFNLTSANVVMEHRLHVMVLGGIIIAAVVGVVLTSGFELVTDPSGYFRIAERTEPMSQNCFDTDGGANAFVRGATRYGNWSFLDDCAMITSEAGTLSILYEGYCTSPTQPTIVQFNCTAGCKDGACIR